jgi:hypothetical protein
MKGKIQLILGSIALTLLFSPLSAFAQWSGPSQTPTGGNTSAPINVGGTPQSKNGSLAVNSFTAWLDSYFAGKIGVGVASPTEKLDVAGYVKASSGYCIGASCITSWAGTTGPAGPAGATGATGPQGPSGAANATLDSVVSNGNNTNQSATISGTTFNYANGPTVNTNFINLGDRINSTGSTLSTSGSGALQVLNAGGLYVNSAWGGGNVQIDGNLNVNGSITSSGGAYQSGMWCGRGHSGSNGYTAGSDGPDMNCQGNNPVYSCPGGFSRVNFANDTRPNEQTVYYYTCIKN